jgi:cysteinyl-tRNA synthetase
MRYLPVENISLKVLFLAGVVGLPLNLALGHEGHHVECSEMAINALKADIQAMGEGEARTTATKEVESAQQMMAKNDIEGCKSHIHSAMEATEK